MFVKACLNGDRSTADHAGVPTTPAELARDARLVQRAGAVAVHMHPRDASGRETLAAGPCAEALLAVRDSGPGLTIGLSTGAWIEETHEARLLAIQNWDVLPDFASVNVSEHGWEDVCAALTRYGVGIEAGLQTVHDAQRLARSGLARSFMRVLVEVAEPDPSAAVATAAAIEEALASLEVDLPQVHHGVGLATWRVLDRAARRGHGIRIGLEDTLWLPDGSEAKGNEDLVGAAVELLETLG